MDIDLRHFEEKDKSLFLNEYSDIKKFEYFRYYNPVRVPWSTITDRNGKNHYFAITDLDTDELIGTMFAQRSEEHRPYKVEFSTLPKYSKKGYCKQAFKLLMKYLKDNLKVDYVTLSVNDKNEASIKFIEGLKDEFTVDDVKVFEEGRLYFVRERTQDIDIRSHQHEER